MKYITTIVFLVVIMLVPISMITYENTGKNNYSNAYYSERPSEVYGKKEAVKMYFNKEFQPLYEQYFEEQLPQYDVALAVNQYFQYYVLQKNMINDVIIDEENDMLYKYSYIHPNSSITEDWLVEDVESFCEYVDSEVYFSLIPMKEHFVSEYHMYFDYSEWEKFEESLSANISQINSCAYANYEIDTINSPDMYMSYDHHWTSDTAYNYYAHIVTEMGFEPMPIEEYEIETITKSGGGSYSNSITEYSDISASINYYSSSTQASKVCKDSNGKEKQINDPNANKNPDYFYNIYLGLGGDNINCTNPEAPNTESIAIVGDSFGRPLPNFFLDTFQQVDYYYASGEGISKEQVEEVKEGYDYVVVVSYENGARGVPRMSKLYGE